MSDYLIAIILAQWFSLTVALIFFLNPISILITGYHSQFDNLAILIGIISWYFLVEDDRSDRINLFILSAVLMGLSLATKHIFIFFPLWILVFPQIGSQRKRLLYCLIACGIFLGGFVPFAFTPEAWQGILNNVFGYPSNPLGVLSIRLVDLFIPVSNSMARMYQIVHSNAQFSNDIMASIEVTRIGLYGVWLICTIATGFIINRKYPHLSFWIYLIALVTWTLGMADQYLAIPLTACAIFYQKWAAKLYILVASLLLLSSSDNIGSLEYFRPIAEWLANWGLDYYHSQIWLFILLLRFLLPITLSELNQPKNGRIHP